MTIDKNYKKTKKMNTIKFNREINRELIDYLISKKHCTLLTNKNFDCSKLKDYELKKGEEKQCHSPEFVNCPAYNQYLNHGAIANHRKIGKLIEQKTGEDES